MQAIEGRRSVRKFSSKQLPVKAVEEMRLAVEKAPSAGNLQSRKFFFVFDDEKKKKLCAASFRQFPPTMPLVVVGCVDYSTVTNYGERGKELYCVMDVSASTQNLLLVAFANGFGSVWCSAFDEDLVRKALELPEGLRPVVLVPVGFPEEKPNAHEVKKGVVEFLGKGEAD